MNFDACKQILLTYEGLPFSIVISFGCRGEMKGLQGWAIEERSRVVMGNYLIEDLNV